MNYELYGQKLHNIKFELVPAIFTDLQFKVILKKINQKKLSQTERNYLSNAIKAKIKGINAVKSLSLGNILERRRQNKHLISQILNSYSNAGIDLTGYKTNKTRLESPTEVVKNILGNYQELDSRIIDLLPVYISKKIESINLFDIFEFAAENGIANFTGYIFEIAQKYLNKNYLNIFLEALLKRKENEEVFKDKEYKKIKDKIVQDTISRRWNVYTLNKLEDYKKYFDLYNERA